MQGLKNGRDATETSRRLGQTLAMAEPFFDRLEPNFAASFPALEPDFLDHFPVDLPLGGDFISDFEFDNTLDFSIDDLIATPESEDLRNESGVYDLSCGSGGLGQAGISCSPTPDSVLADDPTADCARCFDPFRSETDGGQVNFEGNVKDSECLDGARVLNGVTPDSDDSERDVSGSNSNHGSSNFRKVSNPPTPDSADSAHKVTKSPSSSLDSSNVLSRSAGEKIKSEEENKRWVPKRKKEKDDGNSNPRITKYKRAGSPDVESPSAQNFCSGNEEEKRKARLMRNRESAQLSRQRKKHYVEELEDKVRSMHSTIAELNGKLSYIMAENASLRQQVGGAPLPAAYPPPPPMGGIHFPWVPCASFTVAPQGGQVPLIPIPRLKPQQSLSAPKTKKCENRKAESKTKKVASVSLLGLLFFFLLFGGLFPFVGFRYAGVIDLGTLDTASRGFLGQSRGRVLAVSGNFNGTNHDQRYGYGSQFYSSKTIFGKGNSERMDCRRPVSNVHESEVKCKTENGCALNSSEPLLASLYVPRNDRLVKLEGNLIIHSVLASEKAVASSQATSGSKNGRPSMTLGGEFGETGLAIPGKMSSALTLSKHSRDAERDSTVQRPKAISTSSEDAFGDNCESSVPDRSLQQWFHEGLAGPVLSSGMCTEVFQFDISANRGAIVPAGPVANISESHPDSGPPTRKKNRRFLHHPSLPLSESTSNQTRKPSEEPADGKFHGNHSVSSSMVVSVLVDPREASEVNGDVMISPKPKSVPRIFVVVLVDSVKYVTYSCVLPLKGAAVRHLVTT